MGLILDTSVLVRGERQGWTALRAIQECIAVCGNADEEFGISAATLAELAHGIERTETNRQRVSRQRFLDDVRYACPVFPATAETCLVAGMLSGQLSRKGLSAGFADMLIAATALELRWRVVTGNRKHFEVVPDLEVLAYPLA